MAVNVTIEDRRVRPKKYKVENFIFEGIAYGTADDTFRLIEGKTGDITIIYLKEKPERGIELSLEKKKVHLRMSLPTGEDEMIFFYEYVKKICELLHATTYEREGEMATLSNIPTFLKYDKRASIRALETMEENLDNGTYTSLSIYAVYNPIALGKEDLQKIARDTKKLGQFLEEKQKIDAYYGSPKIYTKPDKTIFGIYTITEEIVSIFPLDTTLIVDNTKTENVYMSFVYDDKMQGMIKYQDFLSNINKNNLYDNSHFLVQLKKEEMKKLLEAYKIEV